jgi:hypothetical protein
MSKGGSAPDPIPESEYSKTMARIADEQYNYYKSNYKPFEDGLIAKSKESPLVQLGKVNDSFGRAAQMTNGINGRSLSRFGTAMAPNQAANSLRLNALNSAAATGKGVTDYATSAVNQNTALQGMLAGMGKQAVGQASDGLGTANSNYMAQQQQYQQAQMAQNQANQAATNQTIGTLGAIGMMAFSDERLKDKVTEMDSALDKVEKLSGVTWEWKPEAEEFGLESVSAGVIAQDVEAVLPEAVSTGDMDYKQVNYSALVGLLVNAVKELSAEVKALKETK